MDKMVNFVISVYVYLFVLISYSYCFIIPSFAKRSPEILILQF